MVSAWDNTQRYDSIMKINENSFFATLKVKKFPDSDPNPDHSQDCTKIYNFMS